MRAFTGLFFLLHLQAVAQQFSLRGSVQEKNTGAFIPGAIVRLVGSDGSVAEIITDSTGGYRFDSTRVRKGNKYVVSASAIHLVLPQFKCGLLGNPKSRFSTTDSTGKEMIINFSLIAPTHCGDLIPEIRFKKNSTVLFVSNDTSASWHKTGIEILAGLMKDNPNIVVELAGHASPDEKKKQALSEQRVKKVVEELIRRGIEKERLVPKAYGDTRPFDPTVDPIHHNERSRRVSISILRKDYKPK